MPCAHDSFSRSRKTELLISRCTSQSATVLFNNLTIFSSISSAFDMAACKDVEEREQGEEGRREEGMEVILEC